MIYKKNLVSKSTFIFNQMTSFKTYSDISKFKMDLPQRFESTSLKLKAEPTLSRSSSEDEKKLNHPMDPLNILNYWTHNPAGKTRTTNLARVLNILKHRSSVLYEGIFDDYEEHFLKRTVPRILKFLNEHMPVKNLNLNFAEIHKIIYTLYYNPNRSDLKSNFNFQICKFYIDMIDSFKREFWPAMNQNNDQKKYSLHTYVNYYFQHLPFIHLRTYNLTPIQEIPLNYSQFHSLKTHGWVERVPHYGYKKGHRGLQKWYSYHPKFSEYESNIPQPLDL